MATVKRMLKGYVTSEQVPIMSNLLSPPASIHLPPTPHRLHPANQSHPSPLSPMIKQTDMTVSYGWLTPAIYYFVAAAIFMCCKFHQRSIYCKMEKWKLTKKKCWKIYNNNNKKKKGNHKRIYLVDFAVREIIMSNSVYSPENTDTFFMENNALIYLISPPWIGCNRWSISKRGLTFEFRVFWIQDQLLYQS